MSLLYYLQNWPERQDSLTHKTRKVDSISEFYICMVGEQGGQGSSKGYTRKEMGRGASLSTPVSCTCCCTQWGPHRICQRKGSTATLKNRGSHWRSTTQLKSHLTPKFHDSLTFLALIYRKQQRAALGPFQISKFKVPGSSWNTSQYWALNGMLTPLMEKPCSRICS